MKLTLLCVPLFALSVSAQDAPPQPKTAQDPPVSAQAGKNGRRQLRMNLLNDTSTARSKATLSDEQAKQLDTALDSLRAASAKRRKGERGSQEKSRDAIRTIFQMAQSDAFREDDRKKVREDLQAIRDFQQKRQAGKKN